MRNPFTSKRQEKPFLSPLGRQRTLPSITLPLALTVCGGVVLVLTFGTTLFGLQPGRVAQGAGQSEHRTASLPEPPPPPAIDETGDEEEEPALVTALPDSPSSEDYGTVIEAADIDSDLEQDGSADDHAGPSDPDLSDSDLSGPDRTAMLPSPRPAGMASYAPETGNAPAIDDTPAAPTAGGSAQAGMRPAMVNRAVNLRASPSNGGRVVMVVPANARIEAQENCRWCEISYQGSSGFIYRSFITYR